MKTQNVLSDADTRRESILEAALKVFASRGYAATPVTEVAARAGISQAYVFKLFPTKEVLFVATVERCYLAIEAVLAEAADTAAETTPDALLWAMGDAYAQMIADRSIIMVQVHAQAATDVRAVREAVRAGVARIVRYAKRRSGADDAAVQRFIAYGQLCHLVTTLGIDPAEADWARLLMQGLRHYPSDTTR